MCGKINPSTLGPSSTQKDAMKCHYDNGALNTTVVERNPFIVTIPG